MSDEGGEKTEEPTQKKLDDSRKKGQVAKSRDLTSLAVFIAGMSAMKAIWPDVEERVSRLFRFTFDHIASPQEMHVTMYHVMVMAFEDLLMLTIPVAFAAAIAGALVDFLQVGALFTLEPLAPKLDKLNPLAGLKNMFSKKSLVELLKSMLKISITAYVVYGVVRDAMGMVVATVRGDTQLTMDVMGELVYRVSVRVALIYLLFGIFDIWFQRKTHMKELMMSKDEVKREYKESEGDPHHKAKRKELHQEILEGQQMEAVKSSDVVVTNPDHVAVALKYDAGQGGAPRIVAKALDEQAQTLKAVAREHGVVMLRNVPLAHALYRVDVGDEVPGELYDAVAEILLFVYGLKAPSSGSQPAGATV
ncbi:MAG: type III secretion system export apparatus subunit SctU [Myxococcaceae bacterium]|nr:type III secretion system export apparatus subunit SctU [Myxococcaceae bacterium]